MGVFNAVAVVAPEESCVCCKGASNLLDEICPLCDNDDAWCRETLPLVSSAMHLQAQSLEGDGQLSLEFCERVEVTTSMDGVKELWDRGVKQDPHCEFRARAFGTFAVCIDASSSGTLNIRATRNERKYFDTPDIAGQTVNSLVAEGKLPKARSFADLPPRLEQCVAVQDIFKQTVAAVTKFEQSKGRSMNKCEIGVHMFRVHCSSTAQTSPAPEGRHQDGFQYISVSCLDRCDIQGGQSILALSKEGAPVLEETLQPAQGLVFDDLAYFHDVTAISPSDGYAEGHRDVVVLTITPGK